MQLHQSKIEVSFNPNVLKQVDEAKKKYIQARGQERIITDFQGNRLDRFPASTGGFVIGECALRDDQFAFRIFDETGDRRIIWNASDPSQIREAQREFDKYLKKGWKPYAINRDGSVGKRIHGFDAEAEEIIFDEKGGVREKLKGFAAKFKEVKMMPRTYPG
jgi:hypothetical protein